MSLESILRIREFITVIALIIFCILLPAIVFLVLQRLHLLRSLASWLLPSITLLNCWKHWWKLRSPQITMSPFQNVQLQMSRLTGGLPIWCYREPSISSMHLIFCCWRRSWRRMTYQLLENGIVWNWLWECWIHSRLHRSNWRDRSMWHQVWFVDTFITAEGNYKDQRNLELVWFNLKLPRCWLTLTIGRVQRIVPTGKHWV